MVGTRKGLFIYQKNDDSWQISQTVFLGEQVPIVLFDPRDKSMYAALSHGHFGNKLHRSTDLGKSWQEITVPAYPPKPEDAEAIICPVRQIEIPWNLEMIWSLAIDPRNEGALWCGTIPGGLFHSPDHGQTWNLVESLWNHESRKKWVGGGYDFPGIHSICVDPRDANCIRVGISCGGVMMTTDGGKSWQQAAHGMRAAYLPPEMANIPDGQDPHIIVQCQSQPDCLWSQHHNGIFKSTDGSKSWQEIEDVKPSVFGFVVAVDPNDPNTAWFVPAIKDELRIPVDGKFVVTRTKDGGKSFEILTDGLPQEHAYDIIYRHSLDVDDSGNNLIMGSTTGSLWYTTNQGDSWQTLSTNLPPIFCVKYF